MANLIKTEEDMKEIFKRSLDKIDLLVNCFFYTKNTGRDFIRARHASRREYNIIEYDGSVSFYDNLEKDKASLVFANKVTKNIYRDFSIIGEK